MSNRPRQVNKAGTDVWEGTLDRRDRKLAVGDSREPVPDPEAALAAMFNPASVQNPA